MDSGIRKRWERRFSWENLLTCFIKDFGVDVVLGNVVTLDHNTMFPILHISCKAADEPNKIRNQRSIERYTSCTLYAFLFSFRFQ